MNETIKNQFSRPSCTINSLFENSVINQEASSPRASEIARQTDASYIQSIVQSLFKRQASDFSGLIFEILCHCNLQSLLMLRLVSKGFYHLITNTNTSNKLSPLANNVSIHFEDRGGGLLPYAQKYMQGLIDFARRNATMNIATSLEQLINPSLMLTSIPENRLSIILHISGYDNDELNLARKTLTNSPTAKFLNRIKELSLGKIDRENFSTTAALLNAIAQNLSVLPNLKTLTIRSCCTSIRLVPALLDHLETFNIYNISSYSLPVPTVELSFSKLTNLSVEVQENGIIKLPASLDNLTKFNINLSNSLEIHYLPSLLPNLTTFICSNTKVYSFFKKSSLLEKLTHLTILSIDEDFIFQDHSLDSLKALTIENVCPSIALVFPDSLNNLITLDIGMFGPNATVQLPTSLNSLENLTVIFPSIPFKLPTSLNKLKKLFIGYITPYTAFELPESLNSLTHLSIGEIQSGINLKFPCLLMNLIDLSIENIAENVTLKLPDSLNNITSLLIDDCWFGLTYRFSKDNVHPLTFDNAGPCDDGLIDLMRAIAKIADPCPFFKLPYALESLTHLTIGTICEGVDLELPSSLDKLRSFKIKFLHDEAIRKQLNLLKNNLSK